MMPSRQPRGVQREARLARQRTAYHFAAGQNCCVFRSQAYGFTELSEVLRFQFATFEERLNVAGAKMRLLQCKLRCPRQCRLNVFIEGDVTQREDVWIFPQLQCRLDRDQASSDLSNLQVAEQ